MTKVVNVGSFEQALALSHKLNTIRGIMANPFQTVLGELKVIAWNCELMAKAESIMAEYV